MGGRANGPESALDQGAGPADERGHQPTVGVAVATEAVRGGVDRAHQDSGPPAVQRMGEGHLRRDVLGAARPQRQALKEG